jgi:transposase
MLGIPPSVKIYLAVEATDLRKGHDGLSALVGDAGFDVFSGHFFVFLSRRRNRVKVLCWERGGFVLFYKRLERGRFQLPPIAKKTTAVEIDSGQLLMLLDGVHLSKVRRNVVWRPKKGKSTRKK